MHITNEHLFPLAKFITEIQQKKFGFVIDQLIIFNQADNELETVGGFYEPKSKIIGLNIANLHLFRGKYELECKLRVAAAIVFEECYHAANQGKEFNTDDHAAWYGSSQAARLPDQLLVAQGGQLYKNTITNKKEKQKMKLADIPVTVISGSMFDFINQVKEFKDAEKETTYGTISLKNDANTLSLVITTDKEKLDKLKAVLGNTPRASLEYAGVIYVWDVNNDGWKVYVDVDDSNMVEIGMDETVNASLTRYEEGEHLEVVAIK
jgi:hypothetical protein